MQPIVQTTVVLAVRDGERFVREAVDSVLAQLGEGDELLLVDDASSDRTRACLPQSDARLRVLAAQGRGPSAARNIGLAAARGEFIALLDHDDLWPGGRHRALLAALLADPSADAAAGRIRIRVEADGRLAHYARFDGRFGASVPSSCLYRRRIVERAGGFAEDMRKGEDVDFHLRLLEAGMKIAYCEVDALVYRRHGGNASNASPADGRQMLDIVARKLARSRAGPGQER
jgi:glycosyltransferase involved in cell wall biosynthesis